MMSINGKKFTIIALLMVSACASVPDGKLTLPLGIANRFGGGYVIAERTQTQNDGISVEYITAKAKDGRVIRVERLSSSSAADSEQFIKDRLAQIASIYEPQRSPYFAVLTKKTVCPDKYLPIRTDEKRDGTLLRTVMLYVNDRLTYGSCTEDTTAFRLIAGMMYCPGSKALFIVESFVPVASFSETDAENVRSLQCL